MIAPGDSWQNGIFSRCICTGVCHTTERKGWLRVAWKGGVVFTNLPLKGVEPGSTPETAAYRIPQILRHSAVQQMLEGGIPFKWDPEQEAIIVAKEHTDLVNRICFFTPGTWVTL